jgi:hypothetical protein
VVSREGLPLGYELFAGNRADVTTVKEIVQTMEQRYGVASCIWVMAHHARFEIEHRKMAVPRLRICWATT